MSTTGAGGANEGSSIAPSTDLTTIGFAKLQGRNFTYYMLKYSITLGRNTINSTVDVHLGDNLNISPLHARIFYDFPRRRFALEVIGEKGCLVEGVLHLPGNASSIKIDSQDCLQIADIKFYFLLPSRPIFSDPAILHAAQFHLQNIRQLQRFYQPAAVPAPAVHAPAPAPSAAPSENQQEEEEMARAVPSQTTTQPGGKKRKQKGLARDDYLATSSQNDQ